LRLHVTSGGSQSAGSAGYVPGRPDVGAIIDGVRTEVGTERVAVLACGPEALMEDASWAARRSGCGRPTARAGQRACAPWTRCGSRGGADCAAGQVPFASGDVSALGEAAEGVGEAHADPLRRCSRLHAREKGLLPGRSDKTSGFAWTCALCVLYSLGT
jgi:hypothetical protein